MPEPVGAVRKSAETADDALRDQARALIGALWQQAREQQAPAMGLLVFRHGKLQAGAMCGAGVSLSTAMRFGSITKTFTALTLLTLSRDGKLDPAAPVAPLLPAGAFNNPWATSAPLRVRHLLELSAGLPDLAPEEWNSAKPLSLAQALALDPNQRRLLWPAGLQHSYSNSAPGLSQLLIEQTAKAPLEAAMRIQVFTPLGMRRATLAPTDKLPGGHKADGRTPIPYWHMTFPAFGALNATLSDMQQALGWLIQQGCRWERERCAIPASGLRPDSPLGFRDKQRRALFEPSSTAGARAGLALGYAAGIYPRVRHRTLFYGHGGDADGYRSRYGFDPRTGNGYLVVVNVDNPRLLSRLSDRLEQALATPRPLPPLGTMPKAESIAGRYYPSGTRFEQQRWRSGQARPAIVKRTETHLLFERNGRQTRLLPLASSKQPGTWLFRQRSEPVASVLVTQAQPPGFTAPITLLQGELGNYVRVEPGPCPPIFPFCDSQ